MPKLTPTQTAALAKIAELTTDGPLDVTYGGIKGINRNSLFALEGKGLITIERTDVEGRNYPTMLATIAADTAEVPRTKPTAAQERVIRHFNGEDVEGRKPTPTTYEVCERHGWIEKTDAWPYHRTTDLGRTAIGGAAAGEVSADDAPLSDLDLAGQVFDLANIPASYTILAIGLKSVTHYAIETPRGVTCQCGMTNFDRDRLASQHRRSPRIWPAARVVRDGNRDAVHAEAIEINVRDPRTGAAPQAFGLTKPIDLAGRLVDSHGGSLTAALAAVETYAHQFSGDPNLYSDQDGALTEAGTEVIRGEYATWLADVSPRTPGMGREDMAVWLRARGVRDDDYLDELLAEYAEKTEEEMDQIYAEMHEL